MGPSLLRYSFISDDRYVIVKRKNANGSKTPPKKISTSKTQSGNGSLVRYPDPYDNSSTHKCSCGHISGASIGSDNPSNHFSLDTSQVPPEAERAEAAGTPT